jgi:hypothetical protein
MTVFNPVGLAPDGRSANGDGTDEIPGFASNLTGIEAHRRRDGIYHA